MVLIYTSCLLTFIINFPSPLTFRCFVLRRERTEYSLKPSRVLYKAFYNREINWFSGYQDLNGQTKNLLLFIIEQVALPIVSDFLMRFI